MPKRIIVLGIMRSGTSLTAELIRRWGAYTGGENNLWKSDINDPRGYGYMEYIPLQDLNDELLDHNERVPPLTGQLEERASNPIFRKKALALLEEMDQQATHNMDMERCAPTSDTTILDEILGRSHFCGHDSASC
jgi:hypothetical protein